MNNKYVGENIRTFRIRKKLTQRELGDKIGKTWEMISRYETGKSSPMNQLNKLADVLDIDATDLLRDNGSQDVYSSNRIPFFNTIPEDGIFDRAKTYVFYPAPDWIKEMDRSVFAVEMKIVDGSNGCIFVSPEAEIKRGDKVLIINNGNLEIEVFQRESVNLIGKVLAQEVRFV
jgi:transcriptional regulator with XRE-family HTH domain